MRKFQANEEELIRFMDFNLDLLATSLRVASLWWTRKVSAQTETFALVVRRLPEIEPGRKSR